MGTVYPIAVMMRSRKIHNITVDQGSQRAMDAQSSEPVFTVKLTPHRSLGRRGFKILMGFVTLSCLIPAILFLVIGAWPVFIFLGADILLVWGAFQLNYRAAREYEEVELWPKKLLVRQVSRNGEIRNHSFNPFWTRFSIEKDSDKNISEMSIRESDRKLALGKFLNPDDRASFAVAFAIALTTARQPQINA